MRASSAILDDAWASRVSAGIANGSREALASLYEQRFALLFRTAKERTARDESFALDCVQDAMLRVANSLPHINRIVKLDAWLRRTVLSAALDRLRGERSRLRREEVVASSNTEVREFESESTGVLILAIEDELLELSADDQSLLSLRFRRGLTIAQLAQHLGLAPKAIDSRIRRLLGLLRNRRSTPASTEESR